MDAITLPSTARLVLVAAPRAARLQMLALAARLALAGPLRVLDGGNSFDAFAVARHLRGHTPRVEPVLDRIRIQRAFTCYQLLTLLNETPPAPEPTLVLDMLATFQDESVYLAERRRLLGECALRLRFLSLALSPSSLLGVNSTEGGCGPVVVSARPPDGQAGAAGLYALLQAACDAVLVPPPDPLPPAAAPSLPGF